MALPPVTKQKYNRSKNGVYGELGRGANAVVRYLQTTVSRNELDDLTLIENIAGSEKWDVRDLFQRDVDKERVGNSIMPYFQDDSQVKFFNPLTLILLSMEEGSDNVAKDLVFEKEKTVNENNIDYRVYEREKYFRFKIHKDEPSWSSVEWNHQNVRVVAIDGQHRLSALKRWHKKPSSESSELENWDIPVIILGIFKAAKNADTANLLEVCRKTFLYINTRAEEVNEARQILMNDESVNAVCTQALIQASHENDQRDKKDEQIMSLLFYDWRGTVKWKKTMSGVPRVQDSPAAVKSIKEVHEWFENYLLGEDGGDDQKNILALKDMIPPVAIDKTKPTLDFKESDRVRERFMEIMFPGLTYLLTNFTPYRQYISQSREIEKDVMEEAGDAKSHAYCQLRFGSHRADDDMHKLVLEEYNNLEHQFSSIKEEFPELVKDRLGMRGVMYAFSNCYDHYRLYKKIKRKSDVTWLEYSKWFTAALNKMYDEGWFQSYSDLSTEHRKILTHLAYEPNSNITNYRWSQVEDAFGVIVVLIICDRGEFSEEAKAGLWEEYVDKLAKPLKTGFKRIRKAELLEESMGDSDKKVALAKLAEKDTKKRLKEIRSGLGYS